MITKKNLKQKTDALEASTKKTPAQKLPAFRSMALNATSDMIGGIVVGCLLGWGVDQYFQTHHYGLIIGFLVGASVGLLNVYRRLCKIGYGFQSHHRKDL